MNHKGTQHLETDRLVLRKFKKDDVEDVFSNWASDDDVTHFLTWPSHKDRSVTKSVLDSWIEAYSDPSVYQWCMELKESKQAVGSISVVSLDQRVDSVEIGYCLSPKLWGKGLMTEAMKAVMGFLFDEVGVNRIEANADPRNVGSAKVMENAGLTYTGLRRQVARNNTGICDLVTYEIIREDYPT